MIGAMKSRKLNILMITLAPDDPKPLWLLARELKRLGHRIEIIAPDQGKVANNALKDGIPVHVVNASQREKARSTLRRRLIDIKWIWWIRSLIKRRKYDIVHLNLGRARILGRIAALGTSSKIVSTIRGQDPIGLKGYLLERATNWIDDVTVAVSRDTLSYFVSKGFSVRKSCVIYNGLDLEEIDAVPQKRDLLHKELSLRTNSPIIGMIAHFYPSRKGMDIKGHKVFIRAAEKVLENFKNAHFVIVGTDKLGGNYKSQVQEYVQRLGLDNRVHFLGLRDDIPNILDSLRCLVLPSTVREGFGMVLIEAMARGIPVIGSNIGGIPEVIKDGETGLLVPPGDPDALAEAISFILSNPGKAKKMGIAGRRRVEENFTSEIMARNYESLFYQLVEKHEK